MPKKSDSVGSKLVRPPGTEITSPLAENLMIELMVLRRHLGDLFDSSEQDTRAVFFGLALRCVESIEDVVRPDVLVSSTYL